MAVQPVSRLGALAGRRILVTRAAAQAGAFARLLREAGAHVIETPTIAIEAPESWAPLDGALARPEEFEWVVFTSVNGVAMVGRRLGDLGRDWRELGRARLAAIGPATAAALEGHGLRAEIVPHQYRAEGLVERLRPQLRAGDRVLLPRAAETRDVLVVELGRLGARVTEVAAYRTRPVPAAARELRAALEGRQIDVVTFTSSSTVRNLVALFPDEERAGLLHGVTIASIGPITADTAARVGLPTHIMPAEYTIPALTGAIVDYFARTA